MKFNNFQLMVPESIFETKNLQFMEYLGVVLSCNVNGGYYSVKNYLANILGDIKKTNPDNVKETKKILEELTELGLIDYKPIDQRICTISVLDIKTEHYGTISVNDYIKIRRSKRKTKAALIKFLVFLNYSMNHSLKVKDKANVICNLPESYFAYQLNCSVQTITEYVKALEEMKIIYVIRPGKKQKNIYSLYENKEYADYYALSVDLNKS